MGFPAIKLGLVGAVADSATQGLDSLLNQVRLHLSEVYDPCLAEAQVKAQLLDASFSPSLDGLLRRTQGVIFGDVKWMGIEPILRAAERQLPSLIFSSVLEQFDLAELLQIRQSALDTRTLIMPELSARWARSTLRLRELTATQAGAIEQMELTCHGAPGGHAELTVFDWCGNVMQSECRSVEVDAGTGEVILKFRRLNREGEPVRAVVHFNSTGQDPDFSIAEARMDCRHGRIHINGEVDLDWEIDRRKVSEKLASDRSASDVMFDLFGRRLAGGLVPIPDTTDLIKAHAVRRACTLSRERGGDVSLGKLSETDEGI